MGLRPRGLSPDAWGASELDVGQSAFDVYAGPGGHGGGADTHTAPLSPFSKMVSVSAVVETTVPYVEYAHHGKGDFFLGAALGLTCVGPDGGFAPGPRTIISGVSLSWDDKDGG